jgi:hypothetical protein
MEPFTVLVRDGSHISREKNPNEIAGNGFSMTCRTPRHSTRKVALPQFLRSFMIFLFPKKLLHAFSNACQVFLSAEIN